MAAKIPEPEVHIDLAGIMQALTDYQIQRDIKTRRHINLVRDQMDALNDLMNLSFVHRDVLIEIGFLEPMHKVVKQMLNAAMESIYSHNDDSANMLSAVREIQGTIGRAVDEYERRQRQDPAQFQHHQDAG